MKLGVLCVSGWKRRVWNEYACGTSAGSAACRASWCREINCADGLFKKNTEKTAHFTFARRVWCRMVNKLITFPTNRNNQYAASIKRTRLVTLYVFVAVYKSHDVISVWDTVSSSPPFKAPQLRGITLTPLIRVLSLPAGVCVPDRLLVIKNTNEPRQVWIWCSSQHSPSFSRY